MRMNHPYALAVHGGAGTIRRASLTAEREAAYHSGLRRALLAGRDILAGGGPALDAVIAAVVVLEDDSLFNAGRGAVYTASGTHEMDAAVMDGRGREAGAVAGICGPRNPVLAARAVMERSPHVLLVGDGALKFCRAEGIAFAEPGYFATQARRRALRQTLAQRREGPAEHDDDDDARRHGTVGAAARDCRGDLAAATSTGGMTGKLPGRVGDSPIIGAGTFADNATCAVSATGDGEFFIRFGVAHEIAARLRHRGEHLADAAGAVIAELGRLGGSGGLVAVGTDGEPALPFNCSGMYRGFVNAGGPVYTAIYDEPYRAG
jgi:beta-aspartyl-peptidase (threonine type)